MRNIKHILVFLAFLTTGMSACGSTANNLTPPYEDLRVLHLPVDRNPAYVNQILQDNLGFLWFGTQNGLIRYDGYRMQTIPMPEDCNGYDNVRTLCEDRRGRIWIGSFKGICVWDPREESIRKYSSSAVAQIIKTRDGCLWVAANYGGFLRIDPDRDVCDTLSFAYENPSAHYGEDICYDGDSTIYAINGVGTIYRANIKDDSLKVLIPRLESPFSRQRITHLRYRDGLLYSGKDGSTLLYRLSDRYHCTLSWGEIRESVTLSNGNTLLITSNGLYRLPYGMQSLLSGGRQPQILLSGNMLSLCKDREERVWAGSVHSGVFRIFKNDCNWQEFRTKDQRPISVKDLLKNPADGNVWIVSTDGTLLRLPPGQSVAEPFPLPDDGASGLGLYGKDLLVGTTSPVTPLLRISPDGGVTNSPFAPSGANTFLERGDGRIWLGGWLYEVDFKRQNTRQLKNVRTQVQDMVKDKDGNLWIGTSFAGLWSLRNGQWEHWFDSLGITARTNCLFPDPDGRIWIGSKDEGLQCFDPRKMQTATFTRFDGLSCHCVNDIEMDGSGRLWLATNEGLTVFDPQTHAAVNYDERDGIACDRAGCTTVKNGRDGLLWVGSFRGLQRFDPSLFRALKDKSYPMVFTSFSIVTPANTLRSTSASFSPAFSRLGEPGRQKSVRLSHRENTFVLGVSQMDYDVPTRSRLSYRLDPIMTDWAPVREGKITVANLNHGDYRLKIRVTGRDGKSGDDIRWLDIHVDLHPALSPGAIASYVLFFLLLTASIIFLTSRQARRKAAEKASFEIARKDAELQKQLYASKVSLLTSIAHEIQTPLSLVKAPIETLKHKMGNYADYSVKEYLEVIDRNADRLSQLLNELLDFRRMENGGITLNPSDYDICSLVQTVFARFKLAARQRRIKMVLELPEEPLVTAVDKNAFDNVVGNLLSNAIKYGKSRILLKVETADGWFRVILENDGIPVPREKRESIFRPFERFVPENSLVSGTGIGMFVSRNLVELHGGSLKMDEDLQTNRFIASFPLKHLVEEDETLNETPEINIPRHPYTLLLVEDDKEMLDFLTHLFEPKFSILTATDGKDALNILRRNLLMIPDCIISDILMPNMDGLELCRLLKGNPETSHIPVILLTGQTENSSRLLGWEYGADAYLVKPFSSEELISVTGKLLKSREILRRKYSDEKLSEQLPALSSTATENQWLRDLNKYVEEHFNDDTLTVESLASVACMSSSNLFKKMKKTLGIGPNEYILLIRLQNSKRMLKNTNFPIAEIASRCGFSSPSYFASCFKSRYGVTAKEFRSKNQK